MCIVDWYSIYPPESLPPPKSTQGDLSPGERVWHLQEREPEERTIDVEVDVGAGRKPTQAVHIYEHEARAKGRKESQDVEELVHLDVILCFEANGGGAGLW